MFKGVKDFTAKTIAGANVATIVVMMLVGFADWLNPASFPTLSNAGLLLPVFILINFGFLVFWVIFKLKYVVIPFLGFIICFSPVRKYCPLNAKEDTPYDAVRVLSYNTWNFGGTDVPTNEVNPIVAYISEQDADIVCLQEAFAPSPEVVTQIDTILRKQYPYRDLTAHPSGGDGLALYSKFPIINKERIPYDSKGNLSVAYRLRIQGQQVLVVNNHLETTGLSPEDRANFKSLIKGDLETAPAKQTSKLLVTKLGESTKKRSLQADAVSDYLAKRKGGSIIVCGDFNDGPNSYARRVIAKHMTDCYVAAGRGPGISYHKGGFFVRIDHILCSEDWKPYDCKVDNQIATSDHYPIICTLKKQPKH